MQDVKTKNQIIFGSKHFKNRLIFISEVQPKKKKDAFVTHRFVFA